MLISKGTRVLKTLLFFFVNALRVAQDILNLGWLVHEDPLNVLVTIKLVLTRLTIGPMPYVPTFQPYTRPGFPLPTIIFSVRLSNGRT